MKSKSYKDCVLEPIFVIFTEKVYIYLCKLLFSLLEPIIWQDALSRGKGLLWLRRDTLHHDEENTVARARWSSGNRIAWRCLWNLKVCPQKITSPARLHLLNGPQSCKTVPSSGQHMFTNTLAYGDISYSNHITEILILLLTCEATILGENVDFSLKLFLKYLKMRAKRCGNQKKL